MPPNLRLIVRELQLDLLFLEEFYSSTSFQRWFLTQTIGNCESLGTVISVEHSVLENDRESDLEITFEGPAGKVRFLIENKVDANFQRGQAEDYRQRGMRYKERGECEEVYTALFAPEFYLSGAKQCHSFDYYISYESIREWFVSRSDLGDRADYKKQVLSFAIDKSEKKNITGDPHMTTFWEEYWKDVSIRAPELKMPRPGPKPAGSTFIWFTETPLPPKVSMVHKLVRGEVDIQFAGIGKEIDNLVSVYGSYLEPGMQIAKASGSAAIRIEVPKLNPRGEYLDQLEEVRKGQDAAKNLLTWFNHRLELWVEFSRGK